MRFLAALILFSTAAVCAEETKDFVTSTSTPTATAPLFGTGSWYRQTFKTDKSPRIELKPPVRLPDFVVEGKLELSLRSYIDLVLANNTDVAVTRLSIETSRNNILRQYGIFDPFLSGSFNATRTMTPSSDLLQGADTVSSLTQPLNFSYNQLTPFGTSYSVGFNTLKSSTNSSFATVNPSLSSQLNFAVSQPLLRNRGSYLTKLPVTIARSRLRFDEYGIESQLLTLVSNAEAAYWDVVQARENVRVAEQALSLADASLKRAQRELQLGAISSLDIYQPEAQYQNFKIQLTQSRYFLEQTENALRRQIGADLAPDIRNLPLSLTETITPPAELNFDKEDLVGKALQLRPDLKQRRQSLDVDDLGIQSAVNNLKPQLNLTARYGSYGLGGTQYIRDDAGNIVQVIPGGIGGTFSQLWGFGYPTYGFGVSLALPIRDRRASADYADAVVGKRLDALRVRSAEQSARQDVLNAISRVESSRASVELAKVALDLAQKRVEAEQKKYDLGVTTLFFLLDAQNALNRAQSDLVNQSVNYRKDLVNLQRTTGELLAERNITIR